jgi:fibronectin type 3 domain-containing protein
MKKLVSFLLALVLTLSLTTETLAAVVSPKADATEITADQTVKLTVTASEDEKLTGVVCLNYRVYFDPAFFELDAEASAADFEGAKLTALKTDDRGSYYAVSLLDTTSAGLTVSGDLYTLAFKVKDGAKAGDTSKLTLVKAYVYTIEDGAMKPMDNGAVDNGEVTVKIVASAAPANVTLGSAKAVSGGIQVTWQAASGAEKYNVYRKDASNTVWRVIATVTGTSYTDKSGTAGTKYSYTVRGVGSDGKTLSPGFDRTGVSATMPTASTTPANVTLGSAKAVSGGIQVTWQAASGAEKYNVYRKDASNTVWRVIATVTATSYTDKSGTAGTKYSYTVRGVAADGKTLSPGFDRTGVSATMPTASTTPANVTLGSAKAVSGGIQVTWQAASGAAKYKVYRKDAVNTKWTVIATVTGTSYTDKSAKAGVTYSYTVRGVGSDGKTLSPGYNKTGVSATIPAASATPAKVVLVSAKADSAGILVTWQKANGAHAYRVYRKDAVNSKWTVVAKSVRDTEWKDITAAKGTKYTYTVRAVADDGVTLGGYDSAGKSTMVTASPTTPANVTLSAATAGKNGIVVTWSYAADARTYRVYRKAPGDTKWVAVANVNGKSWTDKNVTSGVKYSYTVRGVNANGKLSPGYNKTGVSAVAK